MPPAALRRPVTITAVTTAAVLMAALLIAVTVISAPVSLCLWTRKPSGGRRREWPRWRPVRLGGFLFIYLVVEIAALVEALALWLRSGPAFRRDAARYRERNFQLIEKALGRLYRAARRLFRLRVEVLTGPDALEAGPQAPQAGPHAPGPRPGGVIVLSRHAGPGDAFLLFYGLLAYAKRRPLVVLKHTLVLDPWIDVLVGRVPHCFIRPDPRRGDRAAEQISEVAADMGDWDALVLFPEGGNFTPNRRRHALRRLRRRGQPGRAAQAERLAHTLPPRPSGALAAIAAAPGADLVLVAHTGLDHLDSAAAVWRGVPLDRPLRVSWRLVPARDVPAGHDRRTDWLYAQWAELDAWISRHRQAREIQHPVRRTTGEQT